MTPDGYFRIRGGSGLGDAIYLQSIVRHLVYQGHKNLEVVCNYKDLFRFLPNVRVQPFVRAFVDIVAHYPSRRAFPETTQFEDMQIVGKIKGPVEMRIDWEVINKDLVNSILDKANGRPILWASVARDPMGRTDKFGIDLLPPQKPYNEALEILSEHYFILEVGKGPAIYPLKHLNHSLMDKTSISDLLDIGSICDAFIGQCGYVIPLAESFHKKLLVVWNHKQFESVFPNGQPNKFIRYCTPKKILHRRDTSSFIMDSDPKDKRDKKIQEFLCPALVS